MARPVTPRSVEPQEVTGAVNALEALSLIGDDLTLRRAVRQAQTVIRALDARLRYEQAIRRAQRAENERLRVEAGF